MALKLDYNGLESNIKIRTSEINIEQISIEEEVTNKVIEQWESESLWLFQFIRKGSKDSETSTYYFADQDMLIPWLRGLKDDLNSDEERLRALWERASPLLDDSFSFEEREEIESLFLGRDENEKIITDASISKRLIERHCIRIAGQDFVSEICSILDLAQKTRKKTCAECGVLYPLTHFNKDLRRVGGREATCRSCRRKARKSNTSDEQRRKINELQRKKYENMTRGVYCIKNICDGHCYVGQSTRIEHRFAEHKTRLKRGCHENPRLQEAWIEFGEEAFEFSILEGLPKEASKKVLLEREKVYISDFCKEGIAMYNNLL
jgi:hypothetical protein